MPSEFYLRGKQQQNNNQPQTGSNPPAQPPAQPSVSQSTTTSNTSGLSDFYRQGKQQLQQAAQPAQPTPQKSWWESITQGASDLGTSFKGAGELAVQAGRTFAGNVATWLGEEVGTTNIGGGGTKPQKTALNVKIENLNTEIQTGKKIDRNAAELTGQALYNIEAPVLGSVRGLVEGIGAVLPKGTPPEEQLKIRKDALQEALKNYEENAKFTNNYDLVNQTKQQLKGLDSEISFWEEESKRQKSGQVSQITENLYVDRPNLTEEEKLAKIKEVQALQEELKKLEEADKRGETLEGQLKNYGISTYTDAQKQRKEINEKYGNTEFFTPKGILYGTVEQSIDIVEGLGTHLVAAYFAKKGKVKTAAALEGISLVSNYAQEFGNVYNQAKLEGATDKQATQAARIYAPISVAISKVGIGDKLEKLKITKFNAANIENELQRKLVSGAIRRTKAGIGEALEENTQDLVSTALSQIYKENPQWFEGATETTVISFLLGAILSGKQDFDEKDGITIADEKKANQNIDKALAKKPEQRTDFQKALVEEVKDRTAQKELNRSKLTGEPIRDVVIDGENVSDRVREAFAPATEGFVTPPEVQPMTPQEPTVAPTTIPETKPTVTPTPKETPAKKTIKQVKKETKPKVAKLKDAEETLKQDVTLYRGGKGTGFSTLVRGKYFGDNEQLAKQFGDISETSTLPKGTKVFNLDLIKENPNQTIVPKEMLVDTKALTKFLLDKGYTVTKNTTSRGGVEYVMLGDKDIDVQNIAKRFKNQTEFLNYLATDKGQKELKDKGIKLGTGEATAAWNLSQGLDYKGKKIEKEAPKKKLGEKKVEKKAEPKPAKKTIKKKEVKKEVKTPRTKKEKTEQRVELTKEEILKYLKSKKKIKYREGKSASENFPKDNFRYKYFRKKTEQYEEKLKDRYNDLVEIASNTADDPQISRILIRLDELVGALNKDGGITEREAITRADKLIRTYEIYKWEKLNKYLNSKGYKYRTGLTELDDKNFDVLDSSFFRIKDIANSELLTKKNIQMLLKKSGGAGVNKFEQNIIQDVLDIDFANEEKINLDELRRTVITRFLPLDIVETKTYASYGLQNVDLPTDTAITLVFNSPFNHGFEDHFGAAHLGDSKRKYGVGIFGHVRVTFSTDSNGNKIAFVTEIQSDTFQKTFDETGRSQLGVEGKLNEELKRVDRIEILIKDYQDSINYFNEKIKEIEAKRIENPKRIKELENKIANLPEERLRLEGVAERIEIDNLKNELNRLNAKEEEYKTNIKTKERYTTERQTDLENTKNKIAELEKELPSKEEKAFLSYKTDWHKRLIKETTNYLANEFGVTEINFAEPYTMAVIEGHSMDEDGRMPYTVSEANNPENLVIGDEIDVDGNTMVVVESDSDTIEVALKDGVKQISYSGFESDLLEQKWDEFKQNYNDELDYFFKIKTVGDLENALKVADIADEYWEFLRLEDFIIRRNQNKYYDQEQYRLRTTEIKQDIDAIKFVQKELTPEFINKYNMTYEPPKSGSSIEYQSIRQNESEKFRIALVTKLTQELRFGDNKDYYSSGFYSKLERVLIRTQRVLEYDPQTMQTSDKEFVKVFNSILNEDIENEMDRAKELKQNYEERQKSIDNEIADMKRQMEEGFPKDKLNQLPEEVIKNLISSQNSGSRFSGTLQLQGTDLSDFLTRYVLRDAEDKNAPIDLEDYKENYESYANIDTIDELEAMYGRGNVYFDFENYEDTVFVVTKGGTESFNQPNGYSFTSAEDFNPDSLSETARAVYNFYDTKVRSFLNSFKKDKVKEVEINGYKYWQIKITEEDKNKFLAYRLQEDMEALGMSITKEQEKQIIKLSKEIFGDANVKFVQQIFANRKALGFHYNDMITILSGQANPTDTFLHEAVHRYIDTFMTQTEQVNLLMEASRKYKTSDFALLEELIAEDFIKFANARIQKKKTFFGRLQDYLEKLFVRTKKYMDNLPAIDKLYEEIISGNAKKIKKVAEKSKKKTTKLGEKKAAQAPPEKKKLGAKKMPKVEAPAETVGGGKVKKSRFMERLNEQLLGTNPEAFGFNEADGSYNVANLERESEKAINFIEADPTRALNIALGNESAPAGYLENTIEVAVALRLKQLGNLDLYKQVLIRNSLKNTRRGQEIASLRGQFNDNSAENYIKRALDARLNRLGDKFAGGLGERATMLGIKKSNKKEVFERIQKEKVELKKVIKDAKKIKSAQDIIDSLRC